MIGKKARKRRSDRRNERRDRRATRRDDRRTSRRDARFDRRQQRFDAKNARVEMRQDTKRTAYEMGIDPNAHWGNTASGIGDALSGFGDAVTAFKPVPTNPGGTMLPPPQDVVDTKNSDQGGAPSPVTQTGGGMDTMTMVGLGAAALLLPKLLG